MCDGYRDPADFLQNQTGFHMQFMNYKKNLQVLIDRKIYDRTVAAKLISHIYLLKRS